MSWNVVPCLDEGRDQLDRRFPHRAKNAEGGIGDTAHQRETSSHNPDDESGVSAEYNDGDGKHEVRARDFDKHLNDPDVWMEDVVQLWVKLARQGKLWWVRYIIFKGRIWHKRDGFVTREYTGSNPHNDHVHVNSDFSQAADNVTGTDWHLADLGKNNPAPAPKPPHPPSGPTQLAVDGQLGPKTISRWQQVMHTPVDGVIDPHNSALIRAVQRVLHNTVDHRIQVDGDFGPKTIAGLQRYLQCPVDGFVSKPVSEVVKALQRRLNTGKF